MTIMLWLASLLLLIPVGAFGMCLPVVRELGRPTRLACAFLCGTVAFSVASGFVSLSGFTPSLPLLFVPLVGASWAIARLLCRLRETPGPESAYPGFPAVLVVLMSTAFFSATLMAARSIPASPVVAHDVRAALLEAPYAIAPDAGGAMRLLPLLWLLAGLPLVAALLAIHVPQRRGWMIAAIWYAALTLSLAAWLPGSAESVARIVFVTIAALATFSCAKEPRLVTLASIALCGAAMTGGAALLPVGAIVAGAFVRDLTEEIGLASRRAFFVLVGPAIAVAARAGELFVRDPHDNLTFVGDPVAGSLAAGIFGLSWALPLLLIVAMLPRSRHRIASLLPIVAPAATLAIAYIFDAALLGDQTPWTTGVTVPFAGRSALSMMILAAGLLLRDRSHLARHPQRAAQAR